MILQRLCEHYHRIAADRHAAGPLPKRGYSLQKVSFCVVLEPNGSLHRFESLLHPEPHNTVPRRLLVPGQSKPSGSGIHPGFLWDNPTYLLGFKTDDKNPGRSRESFESFRERHLAVERQINSEAFAAVCGFLQDWGPQRGADHAATLREIASSFGVFRIRGERRFVHDDPAVAAYWARQEPADSPKGVCLVSGREEPIARLHEPKIKGVRGSHPSGALLVSFNDEACTSFGKGQSYNAPVGVTAAFKYANALNYVLAQRDRRLLLGDATVVFWAEHYSPAVAFISDILADVPAQEQENLEDPRRARQVRLFLSQLREGHAGAEAIDPEDETRFYVLGLSPNASRISVRFWVDGTVGEMKERLSQHLRDIDLVGAREDEQPLIIRRLVAATGRAAMDPCGRFKGYDPGTVPPFLAGAVARAVLTGAPYPQALLTAMLGRLRADGAIRRERVAAIKACMVRNSRFRGSPKEVSVALDVHGNDPAYVTGRLFALLEKIQSDSLGGDLNTTIKDRYFSAASATPGIVFPRLIRLSQHHLAKLKPDRQVYYEHRLGEVMGKLDGFAHHLGLEDQGLFAVGYFHQRQDLFAKKNRKETHERPDPAPLRLRLPVRRDRWESQRRP